MRFGASVVFSLVCDLRERVVVLHSVDRLDPLCQFRRLVQAASKESGGFQ